MATSDTGASTAGGPLRVGEEDQGLQASPAAASTEVSGDIFPSVKGIRYFSNTWAGLRSRMVLCRVYCAASLDKAPADAGAHVYASFRRRVVYPDTQEAL